MFLQLTRNTGFKCGCPDVLIKSFLSSFHSIWSSRIGGPVLPISRVLLENLALCIDQEPRFVAEKLCTFLHSEGPIDGPTVLNASRPGAAPRTISKLSLSVNARSATFTCSLFSWTSSTGSAPIGPNCRSSASPCGLHEPLSEFRRFSFERRTVSQGRVRTRNRCLNCLLNCSRNLHQPWWGSLSEV